MVTMASAGCSRSVIQGHGFWGSLPFGGIGSTQYDVVVRPLSRASDGKETVHFYNTITTQKRHLGQSQTTAGGDMISENTCQPEMISVKR